jgi:hypothetical protein
MFLISGCLSFVFNPYREMMDTWIGSTEDEIYLSWGVPDGTQTLSDGRVLTVYRYLYVTGSDGDTSTYYCDITFIIDDGIVQDPEGLRG